MLLLHLRDPSYTDRLASFLTSVGHPPMASGPGGIELDDLAERGEIALYLRVWRVLYPDAEVELA